MDTSRIARNGRDMVSAKLHNYMSLNIVKNLICDQYGIKDVTKISKRWLYKKLKFNDFINMKTLTKSLFESIYLQIIIMFSTSEYLYHYLSTFMKQNGEMATTFLLNSSITDNTLNPFHAITFTPLVVASLWQNDPDVIRILYQFGADISVINTNGLYPEEIHSAIPYYNHLSYYLKYKNQDLPNNHVWGLRLINDFISVINEIKVIAGEVNRTPDWEFPNRLIEDVYTSDYLRNRPPESIEITTDNIGVASYESDPEAADEPDETHVNVVINSPNNRPSQIANTDI